MCGIVIDCSSQSRTFAHYCNYIWVASWIDNTVLFGDTNETNRVHGLYKVNRYLPRSYVTGSLWRAIQRSGGKRTKPRKKVPWVTLHRCNRKHQYPNLNGYGENGERSLNKMRAVLH